jgi:hypothetical protein
MRRHARCLRARMSCRAHGLLYPHIRRPVTPHVLRHTFSVTATQRCGRHSMHGRGDGLLSSDLTKAEEGLRGAESEFAQGRYNNATNRASPSMLATWQG